MRKSEIPKDLALAMTECPALNREVERELLEKAKNGDLTAREKLIISNLAWVWKVAERHSKRGVPFEDLFQLGVLGLMRAVDAYDLTHEVRITTYATFYIRQHMLTEIEQRKEVIAVPRKCSRGGITKERSKEALQHVIDGVVSLSRMGRSNDTQTSRNRSPSILGRSGLAYSEALRSYENPEAALQYRDTLRVLRAAIRCLPRREKIVMYLRLRGWLHRNIATVMKVSDESTRQTEIRALVKLRDLLATSSLNDP